MYKMLIIVLLLLIIASLFESAWVLFQDSGKPEKSRLLQRLTIRAGLALCLVALMSYGFYSGKLQSQAPWSYLQHTTPATDLSIK